MVRLEISQRLQRGLIQFVCSRCCQLLIKRFWAFSIYKKIQKFSIGNFRLGKRVPFVTSPILGRPGRLIDRERHGTGDKDNKSVNGTRISHWEVSTGKRGLPFQEFRLFRKISSGTNQKVVFHLQPDRNFRNFLVNGKRCLCS